MTVEVTAQALALELEHSRVVDWAQGWESAWESELATVLVRVTVTGWAVE